MKKVVFIVLGVVGLIASVFALMMVASETGEVVELTISDGGGDSKVRLWVVDLDGVQYLRAGHDAAGWYQQLLKAKTVKVQRNGMSAEYVAVPALEVSSEVAEKMQTKYGWRESYIAVLVGGRDGAIPIALRPAG